MDSDKKLEMIKEIVSNTVLDGDKVESICYPPFNHKLKFTKVGKLLLTKRFEEGEPLNRIKDCNLKIKATVNSIKVSVCHDGVVIAEFPKYHVSEYSDVDILFDDFTLPLQMEEF